MGMAEEGVGCEEGGEGGGGIITPTLTCEIRLWFESERTENISVGTSSLGTLIVISSDAGDITSPILIFKLGIAITSDGIDRIV